MEFHWFNRRWPLRVTSGNAHREQLSSVVPQDRTRRAEAKHISFGNEAVSGRSRRRCHPGAGFQFAERASGNIEFTFSTSKLMVPAGPATYLKDTSTTHENGVLL
jgi:hypothetical protein